MSIKKTLQCEKCLARKETTEGKIAFARYKKTYLTMGIPFFILGLGGIIGAVFLIDIIKQSPAILPAFILMCLTGGGLGIAGLVLIILYAAKKSVNKKLYKCPKCGHRMVPVYHHHPS